jgi:hypothetical protein
MSKKTLALALAKEKYLTGSRPKKLLGADNVKLRKAETKNWKGLGLSLAPSDVSGHEMCASKSPECAKHCIFTSGMAAKNFHSKEIPCNPIWVSRIVKTLWFHRDREAFMTRLYRDISNNSDAAIRLNVFSDWQWERQRVTVTPQLAERYGTKSGTFKNLMEVFPDTQFYDYTKHAARMHRQNPSNYHLTFSMTENNSAQAIAVIEAGMNVAVVASHKTSSFWGRTMIDGDEHDLRFLDPTGVFIGLAPKGELKNDPNSGFIYDPTLSAIAA